MQHETTQLRLDVQQLSDQIAVLEVPMGQAAPIPTAATLSRELPRLPANTLEELEAAEAAIHDEAVATVLKEQLLRIGGRTLLETTANIMKGLMGHCVQVLFSLYGRKGKRPFSGMQLCTVATDAICEKQAVDKTTALAVIGKWLPGSVDRGGGRKRRGPARPVTASTGTQTSPDDLRLSLKSPPKPTGTVPVAPGPKPGVDAGSLASTSEQGKAPPLVGADHSAPLVRIGLGAPVKAGVWRVASLRTPSPGAPAP
ncbi:hypothetical protein HPB47_013793 [Ixodes persulcatus]|uniref:Uncharacterized protein n=1 Tax=Ixodes persulcatus TaxID=34615 RepID=A0AC60QXY0_IXOPE|nr:hypothetical protein HPB47_013793 [Ixodes persulcatus]